MTAIQLGKLRPPGVKLATPERGIYEWSEFQQQLIAAIADAERGDPLHPSRGYYESWLVALEKLLAEKSVLE